MTSTTSAADGVFVGIPCYNRAEGLAQTIRCLRQQTHRNWVALISDNASPDPAVRAVAEEACAKDPRFVYHRHSENTGPSHNFHFVMMAADQPFYMWASDDDLWEPEFIATNLKELADSPNAQMSCCTADLINRFGRTVRTMDSFSRFKSTGDRYADVKYFLKDPEILGKANLFYGIFRTNALRKCMTTFWHDIGLQSHGADVVFLYGFVCRNPITAHGAVHLHKRIDTAKSSKRLLRHPRTYKVTPRSEFESYVQRHRSVSSTSEFAELAELTLRKRQSERYLYSIPVLNWFLNDQNTERAPAA